MLKNLKVKKLELFIGAILTLIFIANASYAFAWVLLGPSCGYGEQEGRTIVHFPSSGKKLVSSQDENSARTGPVPFVITAGTYDVTLVSYDGYEGRQNISQPRESWFLFLRSSGVTFAETNASGDVPDMVLEARVATLVNTNFVVSERVDTVEAYHAVYPDTSSANSVFPVCAVFDKKVISVPIPTVSISADSTNISYNTATTIRWSSTNATSCTVSPSGWTGTSGAQGTGNLTSSKTYTVNCSGSYGYVSDSVTVNVGQQLLPTVSITANPSNINQGNSSILNWTSNNATSCSASGGWSGGKALSGSEIVYPTNNTTYVINCSNGSNQSFDNATVTVQMNLVFPSVTLTANPSTITVGNSSTLAWYSQNASYCIASGGWSGSKSVSGSETVTPTVSTNYTINCYNGSGQNSAIATIYVNSQQTFPTVNLSVNPASIQRGQSTLLVWSSYNAVSCFASGGWYGAKSLSGSENISPSLNTTYTLTCSNNAGSVSDTDIVIVTTPIVPPPPIQIFNAACVASPEVARVGQTVAFAAGYAGGTAPYTYSWNQDISGTGLTRAITFKTTGIKTARVIITDGIGRTAQGTCSVRINPAVIAVVPPRPLRPVVPPVVPIVKTLTCEERLTQLINASTRQTCTVDSNSPTNGQTGNVIYNPENGTWTSNGQNKDRSLVAAMLLDENGKLTTGGLFMIWYFVILITIAFGTWIYYLISNRRE